MATSGDSMREPLFAGIAIQHSKDHRMLKICIAYHDGHFNVDYTTRFLHLGARDNNARGLISIQTSDSGDNEPGYPDMSGFPSMCCGPMENAVCQELGKYADAKHVKIVGAAIDDVSVMSGICHRLPHKLWLDLDIVPFVVAIHGNGAYGADERADAASRKCVTFFGMHFVTHVAIKYRNEVDVDYSGRMRLVSLSDYERTVSKKTWSVLTRLADKVRNENIHFSFFNATPQGGGVALMRHAIVRFLRLLDLQVSWHVPKPHPGVFRTTKNVHNILQGVANISTTIDQDNIEEYEEWVRMNCERYWIDGPFSKSDVIILDDCQTVGFIPYIRSTNPKARIIFRSHIDIQSEKTQESGTSQHRVWSYVQKHIQHAHLFVSHPISSFIPPTIPMDKILCMPASTDPIDGLNKPIPEIECVHYLNWFARTCRDQNSGSFRWNQRPYIIQIARFDPSKGYRDVLEVYKLIRQQMDASYPMHQIPQLVLCGHGSVDDPDATQVYASLNDFISNDDVLTNYRCDICMARLPPSDQLLNALAQHARIGLQLSIREGFEVKVSEIAYKSVPVIAYHVGGIPIQARLQSSTSLPDPGIKTFPVGSKEEVAKEVIKYMTDEEAYARARYFAKKNVTEEFFTVWQAVNWLWIVVKEWQKKSKHTRESGQTELSEMDEIGTVEEGENEANGGKPLVWVKDQWKEAFKDCFPNEKQWGDELPEPHVS